MSAEESARPPRVRFGVFELDPAAGELRKAGVRIKLQGQPQRVLALLVRRPGDVVPREELHRELWPTDTFVDFEHNLNSAVKRLRAALGDDADAPRFIETIPRRGYRFLVPVEPVHPASLSPTAAAPASSTRVRRFGRVGMAWVALGAAVLLAVGLLVGAPAWRERAGEVAELPAIRTLAVLPFVNLSGDPEQEYFADGMTEALIMELSRIGALHVISRTSAMQYKATKRPLPQIAKELGVDAVVEGSVHRERDQVRVAVQLISGASDTHLWANSYEREMNSILALQGDVARAIASEIRLTSAPVDATPAGGGRVLNPEAYQLYLKGRHLLNRHIEGELQRALEYFQQALDLEPDYALAHAGVAAVWEAMASWAAYVPPLEGFPKAKAAALRALQLDESLAEARTCLAFVFEVYDWDLEAAEREYKRVIEITPNYAIAHQRYAMHLERKGQRDAALKAATRARALDPLSVEANVGLGMRLLGAGRLGEALHQMQRAIELDPTYFDPYVHLSHVYQGMGLHAESIAAAEKAVALSRRGAHAVQALARAHVRGGKRREAGKLLDEVERRAMQRDAYEIAMSRLELGHRERALVWLQRACEERSPGMAFLRLAQPRTAFDPIRKDARFQHVLRCAAPSP